MWEVSEDSLQQQVLTFRGKAKKFHVLLQGVHVPLYADYLYRRISWGPLFSTPFLVLLLCLQVGLPLAESLLYYS